MASELVEVIYDGVAYSDSGHLKSLYASFQNSTAGEDSEEEEDEMAGGLIEKNSHLDRILQMKKKFVWTPLPKQSLIRFQKSAELSSALRDRANKWLYSCEEDALEKALRGCNLALTFAPGDNSMETAIALEKRAEVLLKLEEPELAQIDIRTAAKNTSYPMKSAQKLIDLQARVTSAKMTKQRKRCLEEIEEESRGDMSRREIRKFAKSQLYTLPSQNSTVGGMSNCADIDYQPHCGRRVVATREVKPGEVVMIDEPYALILEKLLKWDVEHCTNCSMPVLAGIPCNECTFGWFCSQRCLDQSTSAGGLHRYEHSYLSYLKCNPCMSLRGLLACRILAKVGPSELYRIFHTKDSLYFDDPLDPKYRGYSDLFYYDPVTYLPIYHLVSHNVDKPKGQASTFKALILTNLLTEASDFFSRFKFHDDFHEFQDFIGSLILRHMECIEFNAITLSQLETKGTVLRYGAAVYPTLCLINHSCDPNCVPVRSLTHLKTSVIAMRTLQPGEEVTFSYAPHFTQMLCEERQSFLLDKYNFKCGCEACNNWWGPESRSLFVPESQCNRCGRFVLQGQCPDCIQKDKMLRQGLGIWLNEEGKLTRVKMLMGKVENVLCAYDNIKEGLNLTSDAGVQGNFPLAVELQDLFKKTVVTIVSL